MSRRDRIIEQLEKRLEAQTLILCVLVEREQARLGRCVATVAELKDAAAKYDGVRSDNQGDRFVLTLAPAGTDPAELGERSDADDSDSDNEPETHMPDPEEVH